MSDGDVGVPATPLHAYGGPYDGQILDADGKGNVMMFAFSKHLITPTDRGYCDGLYHVYQCRPHPVKIEDAWVYVGVKSKRDVEQGR